MFRWQAVVSSQIDSSSSQASDHPLHREQADLAEVRALARHAELSQRQTVSNLLGPLDKLEVCGAVGGVDVVWNDGAMG